MSMEEFLSAPWKNSHSAYHESFLNIRPAPEFATAEVVIASLYRASGFSGHAEAQVSKAGKDLEHQMILHRAKQDDSTEISQDTWRTVLRGVLESPKRPMQSSMRFLSLSPLVPDVALYSGSARTKGSSWNPGELIKKMIQLGAPSDQAAEELWKRLHGALSVVDSDDIWAHWVQKEFERRRPRGEQLKESMLWKESTLGAAGGIPKAEKVTLRYPARQFVRDLGAIIDVKQSMTRRQWVSLLESVTRLAAVTHVLWLCGVNERMWRAVESIVGRGEGAFPLSEEELRNDIVTGKDSIFSYGNTATFTIKNYASRYMRARLGLNLVLWTLQKEGENISALQSSGDLLKFLKTAQAKKNALVSGGILEKFYSIQDEETRAINCKAGIGSNLVDFGTYTLGQRQTANEALRGYDQGYFLRKQSEAKNASWVFSMGPVAILAMVHSCLKDGNGPRSVKRLSDHLSWYGIEIGVEDINQSDLGRNLRMLGLVLDSPDAESGMLLLPPFTRSQLQVSH